MSDAQGGDDEFIADDSNREDADLQSAFQRALPEASMVISYLTLIHYLNSDGQHCWAFRVAPGQTLTITAGMASFMNELISTETRQYLEGL